MLHDARASARISRAEMARRLGKTRAQITWIEAGDRPVDEQWANDYARALGVRATLLLQRDDGG